MGIGTGAIVKFNYARQKHSKIDETATWPAVL